MWIFYFYSPATNAEPSWKHVINIPYVSSVENTKWGLMLGENNTSVYRNSFNGIKISYDSGETWTDLSLSERGVTDLNYQQGIVYATTYNVVNSQTGLFFSQNPGGVWIHTGPNVSASKIGRDESTIYLGTYSNGLWVSSDEGTTWTQMIGTGWYGPKIEMILTSKDFTLVATNNKVYKSHDKGQSWTDVPELSGKIIRSGYIDQTTAMIGTFNNDGLYRSIDQGKSWQKLENFENHRIGGMTKYRHDIYIGTISPNSNAFTVFRSSDEGVSWEDTGLNLPYSGTTGSDATWVFSYPGFIYFSTLDSGVYKYTVPQDSYDKFSFLEIPWEYSDENELIDKVYSFFDHEYPFLGTGMPEPDASKNTTLNFWGERAPQPRLFYSSHDGIDFALPYGTPIKAPAPGYATYYYCFACGHTIHIDHQNGYRTTYMHLQQDELITTNTKVWIDTGTTIGKVGLTGNTTGPHLHFAVLQDKNFNGTFSDNVIDGRVDPFGWLTNNLSDPWKEFSWQDESLLRTGNRSRYLWQHDIHNTSEFVVPGIDKTITMDNKEIHYTNLNSTLPGTILLQSGNKPTLDDSQKELKYVPSTSAFLDFFDTVGNKITILSGILKITLDISGIDLHDILPDTLKIYYLDENGLRWIPMETIFDSLNNKISTETNHLSHFAAFGLNNDSLPPVTLFQITGIQTDEWFTEYPVLTLSEQNNVENATILYKVGKDSEWKEYNLPVTIGQDGIVEVFFRSLDANNNLEEIRNITVKIDTKGKWKNKIIVRSATFNTN
jgi:murein DD-endopeptidase MepM/ murein hydrolase activator NlpD